MIASIVTERPAFDTGQYEGCVFEMSGGNATLNLYIAELRPLVYHFGRVRWHQFTALYHCTPEMVGDAYFRLVETRTH